MSASGDVRINVEPLGPGEVLLGQPTTRYRITRDYSTKVSGPGMEFGMRFQEEVDAWYAASSMLPDRGYHAWLSQLFSFRTQMARLIDPKRLDEEEAKIPRGVLLKHVATHTTTSGDGRRSQVRTRSEMVDLVRARFDDAFFRIPPGYTILDWRLFADSTGEAKAACEREHGMGLDSSRDDSL